MAKSTQEALVMCAIFCISDYAEMQLTIGVNFTKVLRAQKLLVDPKSSKKTVKLSSFFALLGSASIKAARRTLVKLNLGHFPAPIH